MRRLEWDSNFFNLTIGEVYYENFSPNKDVDYYDLIYIISNSDFNLKIEKFKNTFSETKLIYSKELNSSNFYSENIFDVHLVDINKSLLYKLAYESGKFSRFKLDTCFSTNYFEKLYNAWIDNSINLVFADLFYVYIENNTILGFITCKINENIAKIGLIGVDENTQGKGIGTKLLKHIEKKLLDLNVKRLYIPTQEINLQACQFYEKNGYRIIERTFLKHFWKL